MTLASGPYTFSSSAGLPTTAGVTRWFSSVCRAPLVGTSRHSSLKRAGGITAGGAGAAADWPQGVAAAVGCREAVTRTAIRRSCWGR